MTGLRARAIAGTAALGLVLSACGPVPMPPVPSPRYTSPTSRASTFRPMGGMTASPCVMSG